MEKQEGQKKKRIRYKTKQVTITLHRLIWEQHYGKIPEGMIIHHINKNPLNNDIKNLQCVTRKEHGHIHAGYKKHNNIYKGKYGI